MTLGLCVAWAATFHQRDSGRLRYALPTGESAIAVAKVYFGSVYGVQYPALIEKYRATLKGKFWVVTSAEFRDDAGSVEPYFLVLERKNGALRVAASTNRLSGIDTLLKRTAAADARRERLEKSLQP